MLVDFSIGLFLQDTCVKNESYVNEVATSKLNGRLWGDSRYDQRWSASSGDFYGVLSGVLRFLVFGFQL